MAESAVEQHFLSAEALEALKASPITEVRPYVAGNVGKQRLIWMGATLLIVSALLAPWTLQNIYGPLLGAMPEVTFGPFVGALLGNLAWLLMVSAIAGLLYSRLAQLKTDLSDAEAADRLLAQFNAFYAEEIAEAVRHYPQGVPEADALKLQQTAHKKAFQALEIDVYAQRNDANVTLHFAFVFLLVLIGFGVKYDSFVLHLAPTSGILLLLGALTGLVTWHYGLARDARLFMMAQFDPHPKAAPAPFGPGTYILLTWATLAAALALYGPSRLETPVDATPRAAAERFLSSLKTSCAEMRAQSPDGVGCALLLANPEGVVAIFEGRAAPAAAAVLAVTRKETIRGSDFKRLMKLTLTQYPTNEPADTYLVAVQ